MEDSLIKLCHYNDWANNILFNKLAQEDTFVRFPYLRMLSHLVNAQVIWLNRIQGVKPTLTTWQEHSLVTCNEMHQQSSAALKEIVVDGSMLDQVISYTNSKGMSYQTKVQDILLHIFNHGIYHRAQIAQQMRRNGLEPVNTDYITFVR
ncbi:DinB family protein [Pedobacter sp.]|uniref:DinB family protein n=1 Tax=Pedobacter sp. TaxID=1411316 RepID=UPI003D7F76BB